ncbi:hypothetical protein AR457_32715 [Streptomyces agglomeratus]|uniref:hypothetical protein n=1 Tax=Streptomyces agglomeratus TaxID=285458 RepID=UPI0008525632|nr:hypothetical protein [Streptomyces agglomeratus]OEJ37414.1 hypothetical protein BGK70_03945 [Streptomyces agglomeratus]OEJ48201.1 hypothetical protein AR457_32715 [Streptomyces agglomeratus]OEJ49955.1 hypothetical protein BGK72_03440 [Streptomyces agglomeratus]OEJ57283.1 hypothetical protein BGM19_04130 [Streptomyces agglomeratus]
MARPGPLDAGAARFVRLSEPLRLGNASTCGFGSPVYGVALIGDTYDGAGVSGSNRAAAGGGRIGHEATGLVRHPERLVEHAVV